MATLIGKLEDCNNGVLRGWVWDPSSPDRIIEPIIVVDDVEVGSVSADIPRRDLASAGIGDGRHGFEAIVPSRLRDGQTHRVLLRFPTDDELPANHARVFSFPSTPRTIAGRVEGVRAGILFGWVWDRASPDTAVEVEIMARGEEVGSSLANVFRSDLQRAGIGTGNHGFRFQLSPAILDGDDELTLIVRLAREFGGQVLGTVKANDYTASKFGAEAVRSAPQAPKVVAATAAAPPPAKASAAAAIKPSGAPTPIKPGTAPAPVKAGAAPAPAEPGTASVPAKPGAAAKTAVAAASAPSAAAAPAAKPSGAEAAKSSVAAAPAKRGAAAATKVADDAAGSPAPDSRAAEAAAALAKMSLKELIAQATQAEAKGDLELADVTLRRAYEIAPKDFDVLFRFARVTLSRGDIVFAKQLALDALSLRRNHVKPSIVVARIAELEGDRLLALEYWKNVPPTDSAYFERLQKSARMLGALERPVEAIVLLKEAAALRPADMKLRETLAQLLQDLGEHQEALAAWQAILAADPAHKRAPGKIKAITKPARDPGFVQLPRRYRGIMTCTERPFAIATGSDADAVLVGCGLGAHLSTHFEAPALVVVPARTGFTDHIKGLLPETVKLLAADECDQAVELLFLVPEYITSAVAAPLPRANHVLSYSETGGQPKPQLAERLRAYVGWAEERLNIYNPAPALARPVPAAGRGGNVLLVDGGPVPDGLDKIVSECATKLSLGVHRVQLPIAGLDAAVAPFADALKQAAIVVTADMICAHTAGMAGTRSLLVAPGGEVLPGFSATVRSIHTAVLDQNELPDAVRSAIHGWLEPSGSGATPATRRRTEPAL